MIIQANPGFWTVEAFYQDGDVFFSEPLAVVAWDMTGDRFPVPLSLISDDQADNFFFKSVIQPDGTVVDIDEGNHWTCLDDWKVDVARRATVTSWRPGTGRYRKKRYAA